MKIKEALEQRIPRIRKSIWANPQCYLRLPLFENNFYGPWAELYDERVQKEVLNVRPGSQRICVILPEAAEDDGYEVYDGPVSEFEQHQENFSRNYLEA